MIPVAFCGAFDYCLTAVLEFLVPRQDHLKGLPAKQGPCAKFYQIIIGCCKDENRTDVFGRLAGCCSRRILMRLQFKSNF